MGAWVHAGLLALFLNFVCMSSTFTVMTALEGFWGVVVVACAGGGLIFLARAGTKDPGFICCGDAESNKSKAGARTLPTLPHR